MKRIVLDMQDSCVSSCTNETPSASWGG